MSGSAFLDPALNRVPENLRRIHVMGVCGTGMAALAGMLKESGYLVTGSDQNVYPPMSDFLVEAGIPVMDGYRAENLALRPDLVIVGNVIRAVNPEAVRLAELAIPYLSMPQALRHFFIEGKRSLVVAGTHGKTTTSSMLATALETAGRSPGFMIGGIVEKFGRNYNIGAGDCFVVEGDEYDTAFFDKHSKFFHYRPDLAVLTSVEFDHADIFPDLDTIRKSFARFVSLVPGDGLLLACGDDPVVREIAIGAACPVETYGTETECSWQLTDFTPRGLASTFTVQLNGRPYGTFTLNMPGIHNCLNATAVIALLHALGLEPDEIGRGIAAFEGVRRRQQVRGEVNSITVIDDFAHHPTAVRKTVQALRQSFAGRRLVVVFEPRTNSSRRAVFQEHYAQSFDYADVVIVREHVPLEGIPAEEQFSSKRLVEDLRNRGREARYFPETDAILDHLSAFLEPGDVVAILSNGGFDDIHRRLLAILGRNAIQ